MRPAALASALLVLFAAGTALAQTPDCNKAAPQPITEVRLPGRPFSAIPTADGCTILVSLTRARPGETSLVAVLARRDGKVALAGTVPVKGQLTGAAISPDGRVFAVADDEGVVLLDVPKLIAGAGDPILATASDGKGSGAVYAAFSPDGRLLAISDESARAISIYDYAAFAQGKPLKAIGKVPTGFGPTGLTFSADGKRLYAAVQIASIPSSECAPEGGQGGRHAQGVLTVIDAERAAADPRRSVIAEVLAGCNPVRVALTPNQDRAYVSVRGDDALATFDTAKLLTDRGHALISALKIGKSPVGLAVGDRLVFVTNSDRFGGNKTQSVYVIDPADPSHARSIPTGGFPRELKLTADGKTLLVTNFTSGVLELVDLAALP